MAGWTAEQMPEQSGRTVVVTGGNSGLGYETTARLAAKGARVVLACRSGERAADAKASIEARHPNASLESLPLDLANLASVRDFAKAFLDRHDSLHVLVNNAGVMAIPRCETADGFEMQIGTNHLGHFALTGLLLPRLLATKSARIVNLSSTAHRIGRMDFGDLHGRERYSKWGAYGQSKLANLLFTFELQRRLAAKGAGTVAVACHPGYASTNLQLVGPRMSGSTWGESLMGAANRIFAQSAAMGALPTLFAATAAGVEGGHYIGPGGFAEAWGHPKRVGSSARSRDAADAARLWELSVGETGVSYEALV